MTETADFHKLSKLMKSDWDRRIQHDYRFWMSDGYSDDSAMWAAGERDFQILLGDLPPESRGSILELGCGVGRLLKAALGSFKRVVGFDISESAIAKARELLGTQNALQLIVGNGYDLNPVPTGSVDVAVSFAAISSIPTDIIANYLREFHRILTPNGLVRMQIYLGDPQGVPLTDTLHLRCFRESDFRLGAAKAGFSVEWVKDLVLPFQVSSKDLGINAVIVSLRREDRAPVDAQEISKTLLPEGESEGQQYNTSTDLEYWMSLQYAKELADHGDLGHAKETLEYALSVAKNTTLDVSTLLDAIVKKIESREEKQPSPVIATSANSTGIWEKNLQLLSVRFPAVYTAIKNSAPSSAEVTIHNSLDGPVVSLRGTCLDHAEKPRVAASTWVKRSLAESRFTDARSVCVVGFGAGYHIEEIRRQSDKKVCLVEPSEEAFIGACRARDLTEALSAVNEIHLGLKLRESYGDETTEFLVRPQHQLFFGDFAAQVKSVLYGKRGFVALHPTIGVLGPFEGGTLPIAGYTSRSFIELSQRVRQLDVSGFSGGLKVIDSLYFNRARKAASQGMYCEMVSQLVLESISEKPVDILVCMAQAPLTGRALLELRKRGVITVLWFVEDYLRFTYWKEMAKYYDFVFTIQKGAAITAIKNAGAGEVHYLPTACDPKIHCPVTVSEEEKKRWGSPISFVGAGYYNRQQVFASMADLPFKIWGTEWPGCRPFDKLVQEAGRRIAPEEYIKIFNTTDININLHSSSERDGVDPYGDFLNPRVFELAAAGAFQLVDERTHLAEAFEIGKEIITFKDVHDLKQKIAYYLEHPEERSAVAARARERVLRDHTYNHRLKEMLSVIFSSQYERLKAREDASPWKVMIERSANEPELKKRCESAFMRGEEPTLDALVVDIVNGRGKLTETEQKLLFLHHVNKQITYMRAEEAGANK